MSDEELEALQPPRYSRKLIITRKDQTDMEFRTLNRWNPVMERYEPFIVPADRKVAVYATDMNTEVQCAECGKKMKYGDGYTSRLIHTQHGFGYCVCEDCYNIELSQK